MENWTLHWLEASGNLEAFRADILDNFETAYRTLSAFMAPPSLDIIIERVAGQTIPEMGIMGYAHRSTLFSMTIDPDNPNFEQSLRDGALHRQIIHEVHHCMRMAGPGYGDTLGEVLVSEGLAGQFVGKLLGTKPELWEKAVPLRRLRSTPVEQKTLAATDYDHSAWFYGNGEYPRWLGYSLGYAMVGQWLETAGQIDDSTWIGVPAAIVIEAAVKSGLVRRHG